MKNNFIPENEVALVKDIIQKVDEYVLATKGDFRSKAGIATDETIQKVHMLMYLKATKDLLDSVTILRFLFDSTEEEFIEDVTLGGKQTLETAETILMMTMLGDLLKDQQVREESEDDEDTDISDFVDEEEE